MSLPEHWQQALKLPLLSVSTPFTLRLNLARLLRTESRASAAFISGLRSDSLSTAFLAGYQIAMRFIDPKLEPEQWAAFCMNEKGITSLRDMTTWLGQGSLSGRKSYVIMAGDNIDWLYVVANSTEGLVCVRIAPSSTGAKVSASSSAATLLVDIPHGSLSMQDVRLTDDFYRDDAHEQLNKPFRYHEDVLCGLAFAGWMYRALDKHNAAGREELLQSVMPMITAYDNRANGYSLETLDLFEKLEQALEFAGAYLSESARSIWQRDKNILVMGQKARTIIRGRLS